MIMMMKSRRPTCRLHLRQRPLRGGGSYEIFVLQFFRSKQVVDDIVDDKKKKKQERC